jgi:hypothetical protein
MGGDVWNAHQNNIRKISKIHRTSLLADSRKININIKIEKIYLSHILACR